MIRKPDAEVIIAGGGPAGSIAAYTLAVAGISVLLIEKSQFPRYKVCGGGLTHKILREIPFDISQVTGQPVHSIRFSCGFENVFTRTSAHPLLYCSMRDELDAFLLNEAVKAGTKVLFGEKVTGVAQENGLVEVETTSGKRYSRLVIGAEGAAGAVARAAGLRDHIMMGLAWEAELKPEESFLKEFKQTVFLDWGTFPGGYGWIFPKKDHISVGVGGPATLSKAMMSYYEGFLRSSGLSIDPGNAGNRGNLRKAESLSLRSWPIPVRIKNADFHKGNILITGDAAGLTDSLTGEGIYYAVRSGKLAAESCIRYLSGNPHAVQDYSAAVTEELMKELLEANRIKSLFNSFPMQIHNWVRTSDRVWEAFGKILRGERFYADVRRGFGKWKFLWGFTIGYSKLISRFREKRYLARVNRGDAKAQR